MQNSVEGSRSRGDQTLDVRLEQTLHLYLCWRYQVHRCHSHLTS